MGVQGQGKEAQLGHGAGEGLAQAHAGVRAQPDLTHTQAGPLNTLQVP